MGTETKRSWWRELGAVSQGMLFLDGHIASTEAARSAAGEERPRRRPVPVERHQRALRVLHARRLREMTALSLFR
ncbi:hypothetical protein [Pseudoxanthomonas sp.]|uniref:hypothetical protein n=1 Tax=Pseudoxanthomonas sp. TaxID=1871049 RepID=UPI003F81673B